MAPPSQLSIATSSLLRLVKEEASYHKELEQQQSRLQKLEQGGWDENADYIIKQEVRPRNLLSRDKEWKLLHIIEANRTFLELPEPSYRGDKSNLPAAEGQD